MLKTRNFIGMDVRLLPANEATTKSSFTVKKAVIGGLLICIVIAIGVLCINRRTPGTEKETFTEFHWANPKQKAKICKNIDRVAIAKQSCEHLAPEKKKVKRSHYKHILVDDKHNILYCTIPGTGYSSVKRLLAYNSGSINSSTAQYPAGDDTKFLSKLGLNYLDSFRSDVIDLKLKNYYKFVLVRHPFVRLKSAFSHMFVNSNDGIKKYKKIINKFYKKANPTDVDGHLKISFYQFLQLITESNEFRDVNWRSYYGTCYPCLIQYDDILKLETIQNDIQPIMDHLTNNGSQSASSSYEVFWNINDFDKYKMTNAIFRSVPSQLLKQVLTFYEKDFDIFGYNWDNSTGIHCSAKKTTTYDCC